MDKLDVEFRIFKLEDTCLVVYKYRSNFHGKKNVNQSI